MAALRNAFGVKFVFYYTFVFGELGVSVILDGVTLGALRLGGDAHVDRYPPPVEYCVGDNVTGPEALGFAEGFFA